MPDSVCLPGRLGMHLTNRQGGLAVVSTDVEADGVVIDSGLSLSELSALSRFRIVGLLSSQVVWWNPIPLVT